MAPELHLWTMEEIIGLMDEAAPKPGASEDLQKATSKRSLNVDNLSTRRK
ncbi:MAG: hypothetical protein JSR99_10935 [Proteobacteria bacterium]|nr:hypothetical protein [Pseudomonadota bacterium]